MTVNLTETRSSEILKLPYKLVAGSKTVVGFVEGPRWGGIWVLK